MCELSTEASKGLNDVKNQGALSILG